MTAHGSVKLHVSGQLRLPPARGPLPPAAACRSVLSTTVRVGDLVDGRWRITALPHGHALAVVGGGRTPLRAHALDGDGRPVDLIWTDGRWRKVHR